MAVSGELQRLRQQGLLAVVEGVARRHPNEPQMCQRFAESAASERLKRDL
jgi:hypothetical protein